MAIQLPKPLSDLAAQDFGLIQFILRLGSIILCLGVLVASFFVFLYDNFLLAVPSGLILIWDLVYITRLYQHSSVTHLVTIPLDLLSSLIVTSWGFAVYMIYSWTPSWERVPRRCDFVDDKKCEVVRKTNESVRSACILLFLIA